MAERPIFIPDLTVPGFVREISLSIVWHSGFAPVQKKKNIQELHRAAIEAGYAQLLEISTKSDLDLGQRLSAFNLAVSSNKLSSIPLECAYQGSKIFEHGGPYTDLYEIDVRSAKRDARLKESGRLTGFLFDDFRFPLEPKTVFYDWLYIKTIYPYHEWLKRHLKRFDGFTDIEFNPSKSINCQARSCALFVSLMELNLLEEAMQSPKDFIDVTKKHIRREETIRNVKDRQQLSF